MSDEVMESRRGLLVVISGPSGAGKTTIARAVEDRLGAVFSVSATTRPKTRADVEGRDYMFLSEAAFQRMVDAGAMLEHARLFGRHWYGTPREPVERALAAGKVVLLEIDVQGGEQVRKAMPQALLIFILPPSEDDLLSRLRRRGREDESRIQRRLAEARGEIDFARTGGVYDVLVVNDDLQRAIDEACAAIEQARNGDRPAAG